jgi:hypothetical protein
MGLDMYLTAKRWIWFDEDAISAAVAEIFPEIKDRKVKEVSVEAAYWRKANAVHKWFVDNVQNGVDDCGYYDISRAQLIELRDTCQRVLDFRHLAAGQLPPAGGFFFGGTDIDEYYFRDVEDTVNMIESVLRDFPEGKWEFQYHSSW